MMIIVFLCGVIFFGYRRYKKVLKAKVNPKEAHESEMQIVHSHDIDEATTRIVTNKELKRKGEMDQTMYNEGVNSNAGICKSSNYKVGEEKNERIQIQVLPNQTADFRFGLDKVNSEL